MTARQRGWLLAIPLGIFAATIAFLLFRNTGSEPGIGPVDVLGVACVFAATVFVAVPRVILRQRRASRALAAWSAAMFFLMLAESARQCTSAEPGCHGGGEPLRVFLVWAIGFGVLGAVWILTRPRRPFLRRRP